MEHHLPTKQHIQTLHAHTSLTARDVSRQRPLQVFLSHSLERSFKLDTIVPAGVNLLRGAETTRDVQNGFFKFGSVLVLKNRWFRSVFFVDQL